VDVDRALQRREFQVRVVKGVPLVKTPAEISAANAQGFWEVLASVGEHYPVVVVDMTATTSLDCDGKSALLMALRSGTDLRVVAQHPEVRRTLIDSRLHRVFRIADSLAAALAPASTSRPAVRRSAGPGLS
jgi:anti-anti-sigma factor